MAGHGQRSRTEELLYKQFQYFINEGSRRYNLSHDDCFSAYSDAILSSVHNVVNGHFNGKSSLKTYVFQIFSNKCIDLVRKITSNKQSVHKTVGVPEMLMQMSEKAKTAVERMIDEQKIAAIKEHLQQIGEKCKEILLLFEDGYTDKEIAEAVSYNNAAVAKTTRLRCLEKLRTRLHNFH